MELILDEDVKRVAEFMQRQVPATKLIFVAGAIARLGPLIWDQVSDLRDDPQRAIWLSSGPIA